MSSLKMKEVFPARAQINRGFSPKEIQTVWTTIIDLEAGRIDAPDLTDEDRKRLSKIKEKFLATDRKYQDPAKVPWSSAMGGHNYILLTPFNFSYDDLQLLVTNFLMGVAQGYYTSPYNEKQLKDVAYVAQRIYNTLEK